MRKMKTRGYKSTEVSHFKVLVIFVFTVYGILLPLWFTFHGNKLLNNVDQWKTISLKHARSNWKGNQLNIATQSRRVSKLITRRRKKRAAISPKPLQNYYFWPSVPQSRPDRVHHIGKLLSMNWPHLCCQSINCLRKFPLFPLHPSKTSLISRLRLFRKGSLYGQRIAGLLKPPETGKYLMKLKCPMTCEFWLSDNEYPLHSKLMKKIAGGRTVNHHSHHNETGRRKNTFRITFQADRVYFVDILLTVYQHKNRPFEVLWKLPSGQSFKPITKRYFAGFDKPSKSYMNIFKLYAHSPSVRLTSLLEAIEEAGEDDVDFPILYRKTDFDHNTSLLYGALLENLKVTNSSKRLIFPENSENFLPYLKQCRDDEPLLSTGEFVKNYTGVWKTNFSLVFPADGTERLACAGNRYPMDCRGNEMMSHGTVGKVLEIYQEILTGKRNTTATSPTGSGTHFQIQQVPRMEEKFDKRNDSLIIVDVIFKNSQTNSTFYNTHYLLMNKKTSTLCRPVGFLVNWKAMVHVIVVAKRQTRWLRHFLRNIEKVYVKTSDKHLSVIIAKYGDDEDELMEEYKRIRLPRIRTVRVRGAFDKRKAIQTAVAKIKDKNSIIFLMDLHILIPDAIMYLVRKHTIQGKTAFNPVLLRLSHCGSPGTTLKPPRGFWETFGYGIIGIYKSDWDRLGRLTKTKKIKRRGDEDWELVDRLVTAGLGIQRLRIPNFYHFYHSKKGIWN